jgi:hypothetical protein
MRNSEHPENPIVVIHGSLQDTLERYREEARESNHRSPDSPIICIDGSLQATRDRYSSGHEMQYRT